MHPRPFRRPTQDLSTRGIYHKLEIPRVRGISQGYYRMRSEIVTAFRPLSSAALITRGRAVREGSFTPW